MCLLLLSISIQSNGAAVLGDEFNDITKPILFTDMLLSYQEQNRSLEKLPMLDVIADLTDQIIRVLCNQPSRIHEDLHLRQAQEMDELVDIVDASLTVVRIKLVREHIVIKILVHAGVLNSDMEREQALDHLAADRVQVQQRAMANEQPDHVDGEDLGGLVDREEAVLGDAVGVGTEAFQLRGSALQDGFGAPHGVVDDDVEKGLWGDHVPGHGVHVPLEEVEEGFRIVLFHDGLEAR